MCGSKNHKMKVGDHSAPQNIHMVLPSVQCKVMEGLADSRTGEAYNSQLGTH